MPTRTLQPLARSGAKPPAQPSPAASSSSITGDHQPDKPGAESRNHPLDLQPTKGHPSTMPEATTLEAPPANPTPKQPHRFTRENAREYALRGNQIRWSQEKQPLEPQPAPVIVQRIPDGYDGERVSRVREQLNRVDQMLLEADEPQAIERLSRAAGTLAEQLRVLEGKPLPGSRRPAPEGKRTAQPASRPWVPEPVQPTAPAKPMGWEYDG